MLCKRNESELRRNSRISGNKLRTFVSDENSAKFRRIYCSSPYEISEATCIKVSCTVQWIYQLTKQNWFVRQKLGCYWARKSTGPFEERGPGPETVDSFRYYHVKHGSLGSMLFLYLNAEMPSQLTILQLWTYCPSLPVNVRLRLTLFWYKPHSLRYGNCPWKILVSIREQLDLHNKAGRFVSKQGHLQPRFHP